MPTFEDFRQADRERRTTGHLETAASLALTRVDTNLVARVAAEHPDDPEILLGAAEWGGDWPSALRANDTNAVVSLRYALALAGEGDRDAALRWFRQCRERDPNNLVPVLGEFWATRQPPASPVSAKRFEDYEVGATRARIRCLEAAGYSAYAARRLAVLSGKPALGMVQDVIRTGINEAAAPFLVQVGEALQESPTFIVTELVGQSLEVAVRSRAAAGAMSAEVTDRITELSNRREVLQALVKETGLRAVELATEAEMVRYFDDVLAVGEEEAMKRLMQTVRQPHPAK